MQQKIDWRQESIRSSLLIGLVLVSNILTGMIIYRLLTKEDTKKQSKTDKADIVFPDGKEDLIPKQENVKI